MARTKEYLGPKIQVSPDELNKFNSDEWTATRKEDGAWACLPTNDRGIVIDVFGRSGKSFAGDAVEGIINTNIGIPNAKIIAELETASQAATKLNRLYGYRRAHIFDVIQMQNEDTTLLNYTLRRSLIEVAHKEIISKDPYIAKRFLLVEERKSNFHDFFQDVIKDGGEGLVLKRKDSLYRPKNSSGKIEQWVRVKQDNLVDMYVIGHKLSEKGLDQLEVGLWNDGKIKRVQTILCPKDYKPNDLIGKVIEIRGAEIMDSGAVRSGRFNRLRNDKTKEMCLP